MARMAHQGAGRSAARQARIGGRAPAVPRVPASGDAQPHPAVRARRGRGSRPSRSQALALVCEPAETDPSDPGEDGPAPHRRPGSGLRLPAARRGPEPARNRHPRSRPAPPRAGAAPRVGALAGTRIAASTLTPSATPPSSPSLAPTLRLSSSGETDRPPVVRLARISLATFPRIRVATFPSDRGGRQTSSGPSRPHWPPRDVSAVEDAGFCQPRSRACWPFGTGASRRPRNSRIPDHPRGTRQNQGRPRSESRLFPERHQRVTHHVAPAPLSLSPKIMIPIHRLRPTWHHAFILPFVFRLRVEKSR